MARIPYVDDATIEQALGVKSSINLIRLVFHSPQLGAAFARLGAAQLTGLALPVKLRELLILQVATSMKSEYEWDQHQAIAKAAGVTEEQIAAIQQGQIDVEVFAGKERALLRFAAGVAGADAVSNAAFEEARAHFSDQELVEIVALQGFYYTVAKITSVFEAESDPPAGTELLKMAQTASS
jgi:alkylhydroperoxidase family enzyme